MSAKDGEKKQQQKTPHMFAAILQSRIKLSRFHDSERRSSAICPSDRNSVISDTYWLRAHVLQLKRLLTE